MSTMRALAWAFALKNIDPLEKLVAIYFAGNAGTGDEDDVSAMRIDVYEMSEWCGCHKEDADLALMALRAHGLQCEGLGPWLYAAALGGNKPLTAPRTAIDSKADEPIYLYVISTKEAVKVGITGNPTARFKSLRTAMPNQFKVDLVANGPRRVIAGAEAQCHADLALHKITGEWFSCGSEVAVAVARAVLEEMGITVP